MMNHLYVVSLLYLASVTVSLATSEDTEGNQITILAVYDAHYLIKQQSQTRRQSWSR